MSPGWPRPRSRKRRTVDDAPDTEATEGRPSRADSAAICGAKPGDRRFRSCRFQDQRERLASSSSCFAFRRSKKLAFRGAEVLAARTVPSQGANPARAPWRSTGRSLWRPIPRRQRRAVSVAAKNSRHYGHAQGPCLSPNAVRRACLQLRMRKTGCYHRSNDFSHAFEQPNVAMRGRSAHSLNVEPAAPESSIFTTPSPRAPGTHPARSGRGRAPRSRSQWRPSRSGRGSCPVSYTHLTLPTILRV